MSSPRRPRQCPGRATGKGRSTTKSPSEPDWLLLDHVRTRTVEDPNNGCWLWAGSLNRTGYNNTMAWPRYLGGDGKQRHAHTLAYMALKGPVPAGMECDHLCRERRCCNPYHVEPVTPAVNHARNRVAEPLPLAAWQLAEWLRAERPAA